MLLLSLTAVHGEDPLLVSFFDFFLLREGTCFTSVMHHYLEFPIYVSLDVFLFFVIMIPISYLYAYLLTSYGRFFLLILLGTVWKLQGKI
jgi:hypothetical protein